MTVVQFRRAAFAVLLTSTALILAACGSGSTSTSGSGSGGGGGLASVSGTVNGGVALEQAGNQDAIFARLLSIALEEAQAAGVSGVTVRLLLGGAEVASQTTDGSGEFRFTGLLPGDYTIQLFQSGGAVDGGTVVSLSADTNTRLEMDISGAVLDLEVNAMGDQISGEVEDGISDDDSSDDFSSDDDLSSDDDSDDFSDDVSDDLSDDDSSDDNSSDDD